MSATLFVNLGNAAPSVIVNPNAADPAIYSMLQPTTTVRAQNRYADAYIQPELDALNQFDSNNVTPTKQVAPARGGIRGVYDAFRGAGQGRPNDYETDLFWSVYVATGFEPTDRDHGDPPEATTSIISGATDEGAGRPKQISVSFLESQRDVFFNPQAPNVPPTLTLANIRSRITVHEIGHQLQLAVGLPDEHRFTNDDIMHFNVITVPDEAFFLHPADIAAARNRVASPGA
jgi:hypothetical protein